MIVIAKTLTFTERLLSAGSIYMTLLLLTVLKVISTIILSILKKRKFCHKKGKCFDQCIFSVLLCINITRAVLVSLHIVFLLVCIRSYRVYFLSDRLNTDSWRNFCSAHEILCLRSRSPLQQHRVDCPSLCLENGS